MGEPTATSAPGAGTPRVGRDLRAAVAVGAGLLGLLGAALAGPPWLLALLVLALFVLGLIEAAAVLAAADRAVERGVLLLVAVAGIAGALLGGDGGLLVAMALLPLAALLGEVLRGGGPGAVERAGRTVLLGAWVVGLGAHAVLLRGGPTGAAGLLAVVAAVAVCDTAAYAVGSRLGRRPLAPRLSPNKTWEGVLGGVAAAAVLGATALPALGVTATPVLGAAVAVAVAIAGTVGDLAESMVKRDLGVKDLGRSLPGHGGVLDRVDALLFALPVGHHLLLRLG